MTNHTTTAVLGAVALIGFVAGPLPGQDDMPPPPVLAGFDLDPDRATRWELPRRYREVSGLALSADGRLFAHNDELAIVFQISLTDGKPVKAFALGDRTAADDFEGIAIANNRFYLVSSTGRIYESAEGEDGDRLLYNTYGTSAGRACEIEGLAYEPADTTLIMVCKTIRTRALENSVVLFKWSLQTHSMAPDSLVRIPLLRFTSRIDEDEFSPSGIIRHPVTGRYLIIAARQSAIAEISPDGDVIAVHDFRRRDHAQLEGIELTADGRLLLADEGRNGRGVVTVYGPSSNQ